MVNYVLKITVAVLNVS